jgi:hypothetical protein
VRPWRLRRRSHIFSLAIKVLSAQNARETFCGNASNCIKGDREMQNQYKGRSVGNDLRSDLRNDLDDLEFRTSGHLTDFITVHTFGGRGSPSF